MDVDDVTVEQNDVDIKDTENLSNYEPDSVSSSDEDSDPSAVEESEPETCTSRKSSSTSEGSGNKEEFSVVQFETNLETPPLSCVDEGAEADIEEPDFTLSAEKQVKEVKKNGTKEKESPPKKRKRKKKSPNKKKKSKMDGVDVFLNGPEKKRRRTQSKKRKNIRKILGENELQEDTLKALKEEEERQKRLLERDLAAKAENSAGVSLKLLENNDFSGIPYDLSFMDDIDIQPFSADPSNEDPSSIPEASLSALDTLSKFEPYRPTPPNESSVDIKNEVPTDVTNTPFMAPQQVSETSPANETNNQTDPQNNDLTATSLALSDSSMKLMAPPCVKIAPIPQSPSLSAPMPSLPTGLVPNVPNGIGMPAPAPIKSTNSEVICISSESEDERVSKKPVVQAKPVDPICISSESDHSSDDVIFAGTDDHELAEEDPDVNNSGMHVNDEDNQRDEEGRVLVNKNRPPNEPEIYLSPNLAKAVKPHQIGGIRFMYDNIVESLDHFTNGPGFGCILAHSMGLGKTLQVISFIDVFLRHTTAKTALCVVPVNTLLNWIGEFEMWLPQAGQSGGKNPRTFKVRLLSDAHKTTEARAHVIASWKSEGGVLLMGYEMFRLLTNQKSRRRKKRKPKNAALGNLIETIDLEEEDKIAELIAEIYEHLVNPGPDLIVCDEGHRIKNCHASISQALKQIATRRRIVLTGYPLQNNLLEYWCMVDFVRPNFLGTRQEFSNMFERPICNGQCADSNEGDVRLMRFRSHVLHSLLKGFVQRRSHLVLRNSLPPKEEYVLLVRMSAWQKRLYNTFIKMQKENGSGSMCSSLNPIKAFSICCKIWNHPDVLYRAVARKTFEEQQTNGDTPFDLDLDLPESVIESIMKKARRKREAREKVEAVAGSNGKLVQSVGLSPFGEEKEKGISYEWAVDLLQEYSSNKMELSGKILILMKIIEESVSNGDKLLVFSQSLTTLTLIEEFLSVMRVPDPPNLGLPERKWVKNESYFRLDGNTSSAERERMIQLFNSKENRKLHLFLLSTKAGCLGINLVGANRVVLFDISWNPCHDAQAVCRVYRYGQTKKCIIYRLICDQTMEKKIYDRQISKQGMSDRVVDEMNPVQSLERQDITKLLIYDDSDLPVVSEEDCAKNCNDEALSETLKTHKDWLTKAPFFHESLLMDCKGSRLTKAEKRAAQKGYEIEKRAAASCNYSRPSYAGFYAAAGYPPKTTAGSPASILSKSTGANGRPVANVRPIQSIPFSMGGQNQSVKLSSPEMHIITLLKKSGIYVEKTVAAGDVPLPGLTPAIHARPLISKGESFYLIRGGSGAYLGTTSGRIFALKSKKDSNESPPLVRGPRGEMLTPRERESQIIKTAFNALIRRNHILRQPIPNQYQPPQPQPLTNGFQNSNYATYSHPTGMLQTPNSFSSIPQTPSFPSAMNYFQTMQPNGNSIMMNQSNNNTKSSETSLLDPDIISMVTASNPSNHIPQTQPTAPQLSSLLNNYGGFSSMGNLGEFGSHMSYFGNNDPNWTNSIRDSDLFRDTSLNSNPISHIPTVSGSSQSQGLFQDPFLNQNSQISTSSQSFSDINSIVQSRSSSVLSQNDILNSLVSSHSLPQMVDSTTNP